MIIQITGKCTQEDYKEAKEEMEKKLFATKECIELIHKEIPVTYSRIQSHRSDALVLFTEFCIISMNDRRKLLEAYQKVYELLPPNSKAANIILDEIKPILQ